MNFKEHSFQDLLSEIIDNRGRTCPTAESGMPLIATNCVKNTGLYPTQEKIRYVSEETCKTWFRGHPKPGDMVFVCKGSPGQVCWVPDPVPFCIAQDMVAIRADQSKIYPKYLFALLRSESVQNQIVNMHVGTLIPHFKKGDFANLYLQTPEDMNYQKKVGDIYYRFCEKIELNKQINQTLEQMAQAIFKSWFVDFDPVKAKIAALEAGGSEEDANLAAMQVISGKTLTELQQLQTENFDHYQQLYATAKHFPTAMQESELGKIPEGWKTGTLAELCHLNPENWNAKTLPESVRYVDLSGTKNGELIEVRFLSGKEIPSRARRVLRHGDTIVGTVRPGNRSFALIAEQGLTGSTGFAVLRASTKEQVEFIYLATTSDLNIERLAHLADGGAYPAVRPEVVTQENIVIPDDEVLEVFHQQVQPLFSKISSNKNQSDSLTEIRNVLLPKLLSGELSVENLE